VSHQVEKTRSYVKSKLGLYPSLFVPAFRLFGPKGKQNLLINKNTQIVIEGAPRSANTFSVVAFQAAQKEEVTIAHHLHSFAQIKRGVEMNIPVISLIRNPIDSVKSLKQRYPYTDESAELRKWISFQNAVCSVRDHVVIADFEKVTTDFGSVIAEVNKTFGTSFDEFEHTEKNVNSVYDSIDKISKNQKTSNSGVSRPIAEKLNARQSMEFSFDESLEREALQLYMYLTKH